MWNKRTASEEVNGFSVTLNLTAAVFAMIFHSIDLSVCKVRLDRLLSAGFALAVTVLLHLVTFVSLLLFPCKLAIANPNSKKQDINTTGFSKATHV